MCPIEISRGTFAIAIEKGFKVITIDIEKSCISESQTYLADHALLCLSTVSSSLIACCSFRSNQVFLFDLTQNQVTQTILNP